MAGIKDEIRLEYRKNADKPLIIHMVPHSHDDMGWVKTVDQYYSGSNSASQHASVKNILDSVIAELPKDPKRRFCIAEMGFFSMWYKDQDEKVKKSVKALFKNK